MKPPKLFRANISGKRSYSFSRCQACQQWKLSGNIFFHEGRDWVLCMNDYYDYWENTDRLLSDYVGYEV